MLIVKKLLKRVLPERIFLLYHLALAKMASLFYGNPSGKMTVIGVTGTKGKSSAANFIWSVLQTSGRKTGLLSTAILRIGEEKALNNYHMTMPGRFTLQKLLADMVKAQCKFAVIEVTSEGIKQFRHAGIKFDYVIFTNLYREHMLSHNNSMEEYKKTKGKLFVASPDAIFIVNSDSPHKDYFLSLPAKKKITFGLQANADLQATEVATIGNGSRFRIESDGYELSIPGIFNVENALPAIAVCRDLGMPLDEIAKGLVNLKIIPGRMEAIECNQNFRVYVDYAHQKESMEAALKAARGLMAELETRFDANPPLVSEQANLVSSEGGRVIILLGAEGGGRDKTKRPAMGKIAGELADYVVVSNVDPYEDNPKEIIEDIAVAAEAAGKIREKNLFAIEDRRLGIRRALGLAKEGDVVLITGKGSEQSIIIGGKSSPWDDRIVVREELNKLTRILNFHF